MAGIPCRLMFALVWDDAELAAAGRKSALRVFVQYWNNTTAEGREAMLVKS